MQRKLKKCLCTLLALTMTLCLVSVDSLTAAAKTVVSGYTDPVDGDAVRIVSSKSYNLVPGVTETDIVLNDQTGNAQVLAYMTTISPDADVALRATYTGFYDESNYNKSTGTSYWTAGDWDLTRTSKQAAAYEKATGENVIFATNGDYFNMQTGQPSGPLFLRGVNCNPDRTSSEAFFAVLKDGSYVIRDKGSKTDDVMEAVGSPFYLVKNGVNVCNPGFTTLYPVNSVGFKADGTVVFFMADGRQYPTSVGMSQYEMAQFLVEQGVVTALYLDGGGSATVLTQREGEDDLTVRNNPSDGAERSISSGFLLIANASSDGVFDHVAITPNSEKYTPGSAVQFTAAGVDAAGGAAEIPESGVNWALAAESAAMGAIDATTGVFVSNGTQGEVTVEAYVDGVFAGSTAISVAEPDTIYFDAASASLDFGEESSLGLMVRAEGSDINYKDGDFVWSFASKTEGVANSAVGHMNGNTFVANNNGTSVKADVTVSYTRVDGTVLTATISVEIGKMPIVAMDFEPNENGQLTGAHYHWGKNTYVNAGLIPGYYGAYDTLTVPVANTYSAVNPTVYATLTAPYSFTGNYDSAVPAAEIFKRNGYTFYLWPNNSVTTYNAGSVKTTTEADGGQVRFGEYSLELNYDYASYDGSSNANYYIRYCGEPIEVEGQPTQVGVWVYADAETYNLAGYFLYCDIAVFNGSTYSTKNLALVHDNTDENGNVVKTSDIDWVGWMYCYADLSALASYYSPEHPYKIRTGEGMFWLSYQPKRGGGRYSGTFYFDNYRFVYGTDLDDLDNPEITSVSVNGTVLDDSDAVTVYTNDIEITATFRDPDGKNASGINATSTSFKVDGKDIPCDGDTAEATTRMSLDNGYHSVQVTVMDAFDNAASVTKYFYVQNETDTATATLEGADTVTMGSNYEMSLVTKGTVAAVEAEVIQLNSDFSEPSVAFAEGWTGSVEYASTGFKKAKIDITAQWAGEGEVPADAKAVTLSFNVPTTLDPEIDFFTYQVKNVTCTLPDGTTTTAAQKLVKLSLSAYYTVNAEIAIAGQDTLLKVVDPNGDAAAFVDVFVNDICIGQTDENGEIVTTVSEALSAGNTFKVMVKNGSLVSFTTTITVMADIVSSTPVGVALTASKHAANEQTITWMSSAVATEASAYVEYATDEAFSDAVIVAGISTLHAFNTSKNAARINSVVIADLEEGKTYYYKVGDGINWSEVSTFKTTAKDDTTTFFVIGDTQMNGNVNSDADEIALLQGIANQVAGYDFGIQTGDYIDNGGNYKMWEELQTVFGQSFTGIDMIHTYGNHEYYGDANGDAASLIYNLSGTDSLYYSVEYGNVYVAVINYNANLSEALAWLEDDAKASDATWKVLSVHQPPYYTNVNGGSERFNKAIPAVAEAAGINAVFSGHDHAYARTLPMTAGAVDEEQGVVYFVCGDLGEKSRNINYAAVNTPEFNFAAISQDYSAVAIKVEATEETLTFKTVDADGTLIDSYTMKKFDPCEEGHTFDTYDRETGMLTCSVCEKSFDASEILYSGWATDKETGAMMYFVGGSFVTGFVKVENVGYAFDEQGLPLTGFATNKGYTYYCVDGYAQTGLQIINEKYYYFEPASFAMKTGTFTVPAANSNGLLEADKKMTFVADIKLVTDEKGNIYCYVEGLKTYLGLVDIDGSIYYINSKGKAVTGNYYVSKNNKHLTRGYYDFDENGKMLNVKHGIITEDGVMYYYRFEEKYYGGLIKIGEDYYYADENGVIVTGEYKVLKTNGLMPVGTYKFDENGKLVVEEPKNGLVEEDGVLYYYVDSQKVHAGLILVDGAYYYINSNGVAVTGTYYVNKTNDLMPAGRYEFGEDGKMIIPEVKNGIVTEDGTMYYYVDGSKVYAGLIAIDGSYYYVNKKGIVVTGVYYVNKTNDLMPAGRYEFGEDGKMIVPEVKNGFVVENGVKYYYENDAKVYAGLIIVDGDYYYVNTKGIVVTGTYYIKKTNDLMPVGRYEFDEEGKMIIETSEETEEEATPSEELTEENTEESSEGMVEETTEEESEEESTETSEEASEEPAPEEPVESDEN